jgi:nucleoside 2-deoxyribosyltransferase
MITIVGGTYHERCFEPHFDETFGSGLRACKVMLNLKPDLQLNFHTFLQSELNSYVNSFSDLYRNFQPFITPIDQNILFYYDYPLSYPHVFPRLDSIDRKQNHIAVQGDNILVYGCIEGTTKVDGNMVVYDPQSPNDPQSFIKNGSNAKKLTIVLNWSEAKALSKCHSINDVLKYFFKTERADVLIIKKGAQGADIYNRTGNRVNIPVYETSIVWNIGSGDVFVAVYSYHWFQGIDEFEAAKLASYATAEYCNSRNYQFANFESDPQIKPLCIESEPSGHVYLAGPFFTFSQRWLIDRIRKDLKEMGLKVFSPYHDVGYGDPQLVARMDIEALDNSSLLFAVLDGLDSGTLFEAGYAASKQLPIIGFVQNETDDSLTMLNSADCDFVNDLTTAIYKTYWKMSKRYD